MHTIVLATQKGGSGKSTLAVGLALAAKQAGFSVRRWIETRLELSTTTNVLIDQVMSAADGMLHVTADLAADETTTLAS